MASVMYSLIIILIIALPSIQSDSSSYESSEESVVVQFAIKQQLDHFDSENNATFNMRYYMREDFWRSGGPVYVYIGEEYSADNLKDYLINSILVDMASETNGLLYLLEHRYFGESDISNDLEEKRFEYLSIKQVLGDVANFLRKVKEVGATAKSKIVVVGGSYGGRLATWMRLKYPKLVDAAVASSAPLKNSVEFPEYYEHVADVYKEYGGYKCLRAIQNKIKHERGLLRHDSGEDSFKMEEHLCPEVEIHDKSQKNMYGALILNFIAKPVVNFNLENIINKCEAILSPVHISTSKGCFWFDFKINGWPENPYDYLRCTELAQFPTSSETGGLPYSLPIELYNKRCAEVYGDIYGSEHINRAMSRLEEEYGGLTPNVTKVVFVNGGLDPWHHLGVLKDLSAEAPAIFMRNTTHCEDLQANKPTDSRELRDSRLRIKELIKDWIGFNVHLPSREWTFFRSSPTWDHMQ